MNYQITNTILMIRPVQFRMNEQTAVNNYYQKVLDNKSPQIVNSLAVKEFDAFVKKLRASGIEVIVVQDTQEFDTPDSIFPNNWISFHQNGSIALYPMFAKNRRLERKESVVKSIENHGFSIASVQDYTGGEAASVFLEGTGSVILDRINRKAYCALSPRADEGLFIEFCEDFDFFPVVFSAYQNVGEERLKIYHTNVMMCVGDTFAVVCLKAIDDKKERKIVLNHLKKDGKTIIEISENQVNQFAANMLQLQGNNQSSYIAMSQTALESFGPDQIAALRNHGRIISSSLDTIEACGGGSARCMMAEIFLPKAAQN